MSKHCKLEVYEKVLASTNTVQPRKDQCDPSSTSITITNASNIILLAPELELESNKEPEPESPSHQSSPGPHNGNNRTERICSTSKGNGDLGLAFALLRSFSGFYF